MITAKTDAFLDICVSRSLRESLGYSKEDQEKWSIKSCYKSEFLDPEYDPFKMLEFQLMADTIRKKYGIEKEPDDVL